MARPALVSRDAAITAVARSLGFSVQPDTRDSFLCELIRATTWALTGGSAPVYVATLLNRATSLAAALAPQADDREIRAELREALDAIADLGDLVELDGGFWLPCPTRVVPLERETDVLLVGGLPAALLSDEARSHLAFRGPLRKLSATPSELALPSESLHDWVRLPKRALQPWADEILDCKLPPYDDRGGDDSSFEFYAPEFARGHAPQFKRWLDKVGHLAGRHLARRSRIYRVQEYRIVELRDGRITHSGAVLAPGEARRLMYALDARAENPVVVTMKSSSGRLELVTTSELPRPEQRLFRALGTMTTPANRHYERHWLFHSDLDLVLERLHALGTKVKTVS